MNSNGTEKITIIHLNESTPPINISSAGWTTSNMAKMSLKLPELSILELLIDADAKIYEVESYVVHRNIIHITPKPIKR